MLPDAMVQTIIFESGSLAEALQVCWSALDAAGLPVSGWRIPSDTPSSTAGLEQAVSRAAAAGKGTDAVLKLAAHSEVAISLPAGDNLWRCQCWLSRSDTAYASIPDALQHEAELCRTLLRAGHLVEAGARRQGGGANCLPEVPIAGYDVLVVTTEAAVIQAYEQPEVFWQARWEVDERFGEHHLLLRASKTVDSTELLRQIIEPQWAMARAARPGQTRYGAPLPEPEEEPIFFAGEPTVTPVGHVAPENLAFFSCYLGSGQHIHGWEIYYLRDIVNKGRLPDGRPVTQVWVIFLDRAIAEQEKRPLLDVGVHAFYTDENGQRVEIV